MSATPEAMENLLAEAEEFIVSLEGLGWAEKQAQGAVAIIVFVECGEKGGDTFDNNAYTENAPPPAT